MSQMTESRLTYSELSDRNVAKANNESKFPFDKAEFGLKEIQEALRREFRINAHLERDENKLDLEWRGQDGSLLSIAFWNDGEVIFYHSKNRIRKTFNIHKEPSYSTFYKESSKLMAASII